ncbi:CinA family protein [Roseibium sp.]|uniref:CinA family protein n=1 Tax=Roseibium sp. TaxID=1936156 RepID=UPI003A96A992
MTTWEELLPLAQTVISKASKAGVMIATAESCTGGLISGLLTEVTGSSAVLDRGFTTYSNEAKQDMLGVPVETLAAHGAVSAPTARAMAEGALTNSRAQIAVSVTGIAGPTGGTPDKPVGTVYFGIAVEGHDTSTSREQFGDRTRQEIRLATVRNALQLISNAIDSASKI